MAKKKYTITHSNFTVKKKHKTIDGERTIYERDYMILNGRGGNDNGIINDGSSSFKITRNVRKSSAKRHKYGEWLKNEACGSEFWTKGCIDEKESGENKLTIKPNCNSLLEFAYYGSCTELIKSTISKIIDTFNGELYFTDYEYKVANTNKTMYLIDNPFAIKLYGNVEKFNSDDIRDFFNTYINYSIIKPNGQIEEIKTQPSVTNINKNLNICHNDWDLLYTIKINNITISSYFVNGDEILLYEDVALKDTHIRPTEKFESNFFENLDDFGKVMLNRSSVPIYTMVLDYPHETENGIETYKDRFTWPLSDRGGYNLDINSGDFTKYINKLLDLATFYDNRQTNNLWRMLTHDSIKNMDNTFKKGGDDVSDYSFGSSKIEGLLMTFGRQFDELKRYTDNIKSCNVISYNDNNNIPDYLVSDKLELSGWETVSVAPDLSNKELVKAEFSGDNGLYSSSDININFLKYLQINSKDILRRKGTKHGIEMVLSLFGLKSEDFVRTYNDSYGTELKHDYSITEYVNIIDSSKVTNIDIKKLTEFNEMVKGFEYEPDESDIETNYLQGLPLRILQYYDEDKNENVDFIVPWFDKKQKLYSNPYFQMYGGWGKVPEKKIVYNGKDETLYTTPENGIYDETVNNIHIVRKVSDLYLIPKENVSNDVVYYVVDNINVDNKSNYFILLDATKYSSQDGWYNIENSEIEEGGKYRQKVMYLESIVENYKGNNPHSGNGKYDDGVEYLRYFKEFFRGALKDNMFTNKAYNCDGDLNSEINKFGFDGLFNNDGNVLYYKDNVKTWYFSDEEDDMYCNADGRNEKCKNVEVGVNNKETFYESNFNSNNDEYASYYIMNNKVLSIKFEDSVDFDYVNRSILPFIKQVIPSTTILKIENGA